MKKSEIRKKLIRYKEILKETKIIYAESSKGNETKTKEIKALENKIKELENKLYNERN